MVISCGIPFFNCCDLITQRLSHAHYPPSLNIDDLPCFKTPQLNLTSPQNLSMRISKPTLCEMHSKEPFHKLGKLRVENDDMQIRPTYVSDDYGKEGGKSTHNLWFLPTHYYYLMLNDNEPRFLHWRLSESPLTSHMSQEPWPRDCESQKKVFKGRPNTPLKSCCVVTDS
jgi:hypothetical protein